MEAELLRDMIADRDKRIEKIKRKSHEQHEKELVLCRELEQVGAQNTQQRRSIQREKDVLARNYKIAARRLDEVQRNFRQQGASLRTYCGKVKAEQANDSGYVMRMQAQLCKAMHSMGITDHQFQLAKDHCDSIVKYQKEQITSAAEEKTQKELKLMNDMMAQDSERREIETKFEEQLAQITKEREALERQIEENRDSDEESDDDEEEEESEEDDEEEKEAKEELMKMLQERREEIERLQNELEEEDETIQEMEEELEEIKEVVSSDSVSASVESAPLARETEEDCSKEEESSKESGGEEEEDDEEDEEERKEDEKVEAGVADSNAESEGCQPPDNESESDEEEEEALEHQKKETELDGKINSDDPVADNATQEGDDEKKDASLEAPNHIDEDSVEAVEDR